MSQSEWNTLFWYAIDNVGTSYWIEVTGWEEPVVGYRCGNGQGCFAVEDFRVNNVADFINDKIEFTFN